MMRTQKSESKQTVDPVQGFKKSQPYQLQKPTVDEMSFPHDLNKVNADPYSPKITSSKEAYHLFRAIWRKDLITVREQIYCLFLDKDYRLIDYKYFFTGDSKGVAFDSSVIFRAAIMSGAYSFIFAHNHPSGDVTPSAADNEVTEVFNRLSLIHKNMVWFIDHIIVTTDGFYSYSDNNLIQEEPVVVVNEKQYQELKDKYQQSLETLNELLKKEHNSNKERLTASKIESITATTDDKQNDTSQMVIIPAKDYRMILDKVADLETRFSQMENGLPAKNKFNDITDMAYKYSKGGLLKLSAVAKLLGYHRDTIYKKLKKDFMSMPPFVYDNRRYVIPVENFLEWYKKQYSPDSF